MAHNTGTAREIVFGVCGNDGGGDADSIKSLGHGNLSAAAAT